jgi:hypothetical protein
LGQRYTEYGVDSLDLERVKSSNDNGNSQEKKPRPGHHHGRYGSRKALVPSMVKFPGPGWKTGWTWIGDIQVTVEVNDKVVNFSGVRFPRIS